MHNSDVDDADSLLNLFLWQWFDWVETSNQLLFLNEETPVTNDPQKWGLWNLIVRPLGPLKVPWRSLEGPLKVP